MQNVKKIPELYRIGTGLLLISAIFLTWNLHIRFLGFNEMNFTQAVVIAFIFDVMIEKSQEEKNEAHYKIKMIKYATTSALSIFIYFVQQLLM